MKIHHHICTHVTHPSLDGADSMREAEPEPEPEPEPDPSIVSLTEYALVMK